MGGFVRAATKVAKKVVEKSPTAKLAKKVLGGEKKQGIELAKSVDNKVGEIQKTAANNVKGPTTTEMSTDQILLANKRKGRKVTNITNKKTLAKNYKLSEKSLLG